MKQNNRQTSSVVQAGAIEPLLQLLNSPQLEVQEQSVWALGNIAGDCDEEAIEKNMKELLVDDQYIVKDTFVFEVEKKDCWKIKSIDHPKKIKNILLGYIEEELI